MAAPPAPVPPWIDGSALWKIVVLALIAGAGLPALFAVGLRALAIRGGSQAQAQTETADSDQIVGGSPVGMVVAGLCFLVVLAAIGWGIWQIWYAGHPH
jgi:hypothetical protein